MIPLKILLVDDSKNMRTIVRRYLDLDFKNMEFFEASNGLEAEEILDNEFCTNRAIDIVFLDWMMPVMSGLEFLQKIRKKDKYKTYPYIIMLTAENYTEQMNTAMKQGVSAYIRKPFSSIDLKTNLEKVIAAIENRKVA